MAEETAALSTGTEKTEDTSTAPSTSAEKADGMDIETEAKKLMATGQKHLVMKDVRSAVTSFQEASSLLAKKYGETADECADAFYSYGMSLLELARMENGVLGNALEGMPEDEEDGEKEDPNIPSADNLDEKERDQLREQVYNAMAEDERASKSTSESEGKGKPEDESNRETDEKNKPVEKMNGDMETEDVTDGLKADSATQDVTMDESGKAEAAKGAETPGEHTEKENSEAETQKEKISESKENESKDQEKTDAKEIANQSPDSTEVTEERTHTDTSEKMDSEVSAETEEPKSIPTENEASKPDDKEKMEGEEEEGEDSEENDEGTEENEGTEEKETEEEDVGNLQLAWEMLDLCKLIFKRQQSKEAQLKAAQAHLKLGEVSVESENYSQAVEDFLACLNIQKEHLEEHDRLLAETNYHLGLAYQYSSKHEDAISHFTQSVGVIEKRMGVLTKQLETSVGEPDEVKKEMDELKDLLPDIKEKIEDSKEAQKNATATEIALKETLVGGSSGFSQENGSTSASSTTVEKSGDSTVPVTNCVSDISHLVRKKRKPEEESPLKDKDAKKSKQEPVANGAGNGDAVVPTNEEAEKAEEASMETAAVETTA